MVSASQVKVQPADDSCPEREMLVPVAYSRLITGASGTSLTYSRYSGSSPSKVAMYLPVRAIGDHKRTERHPGDSVFYFCRELGEDYGGQVDEVRSRTARSRQ